LKSEGARKKSVREGRAADEFLLPCVARERADDNFAVPLRDLLSPPGDVIDVGALATAGEFLVTVAYVIRKMFKAA
jgi:hypothetical protein